MKGWTLTTAVADISIKSIVIFDLLKTDLKGKKKTEKIDKIVVVEDELSRR